MRALTTMVLALGMLLGGAAQAQALGTKTKHDAVRYAKSKVGNPYGWGQVGPYRFDCSGLTYAAYKRKIPRTAAAQRAAGRRTSARRKGDLLFRGSGHVGIYVGNGQAIHSTKPGSPVRYIRASYFNERRAP